jgi:hypothetical protein
MATISFHVEGVDVATFYAIMGIAVGGLIKEVS